MLLLTTQSKTFFPLLHSTKSTKYSTQIFSNLPGAGKNGYLHTHFPVELLLTLTCSQVNHLSTQLCNMPRSDLIMLNASASHQN